MNRWLKLDLAGPMLAFGGVAIDHVGPTRDFPAASMLTGLFANALGWHWRDGAAHQSLQDRLVFGAAVIAEGRALTDSQNVRLEKTDRGWTTWGIPRAGMAQATMRPTAVAGITSATVTSWSSAA